MRIRRLYAGPDGRSRMEELDLAVHPELTNLHAARGVIFRVAKPGSFEDWHVAPQRQYVITLSGEAEIGVGDGTLHHFGPGDVDLVEDLTGHGHTTRIVGTQPRIAAIVRL